MKPKYMIHACPQRMWYVNEFLLPSLLEQGIPEKDITVWNDSEKKGNLAACMAAFESLPKHGGTWHLQDDVVICKDFAERTKQYDKGVVYGFCNRWFKDDPAMTGTVYAEDAWNSFQCVRIPNEYAHEAVAWFKSGAAELIADLAILIKLNKGDDTLFREFFLEKHGRETAVNLAPNLVNHIDYMIGGPVTNHWRSFIAGSDIWENSSILYELHQKLKERGK